MTVLAEIGKNARLLALLFEALQRPLKVLVVMDYDFRQNLLPPFLATSVAGLGQTCKVRPRTGLGQANSDCRFSRASGQSATCGVGGASRPAPRQLPCVLVRDEAGLRDLRQPHTSPPSVQRTLTQPLLPPNSPRAATSGPSFARRTRQEVGSRSAGAGHLQS